MSVLDRRLLLVTGKGGVGKTTLAAALAFAALSRGKRVLCAEVWTDTPARTSESPLSALLGVKGASHQPVRVVPGLSTVLLAPSEGQRRFLRQVLPRLLVDAALRTTAIRRFMTAAPGLPEMGVMYQLLEHLRERTSDGRPVYETCIVDAPSTGHALALAQIPSLLLRVIPSGRVSAAAREGLSLLTDRTHTGTVVVTLPAKLPVGETVDLCRGLEQHHVPIAALVANRIPIDPFNSDEKRELKERLERERLPGERSFRRILGSQASLAQLAQAQSHPTYAVPELDLPRPELARAISDVLQRVQEAQA